MHVMTRVHQCFSKWHYHKIAIERGSLLHLIQSMFFFPQIPCNHTYLVLRRRGASRADHVYRFNKAASLGVLGPLSPVRQFAISVVTNRYPLRPRRQPLNRVVIYIFSCYFSTMRKVIQRILIPIS